MSAYTALARRWRPRTFAEMVGQEHVLRALANALASGRVHHAFLFAGTRGVGKTSVARILAKCLNCERGERAVPCGECASCREIDEGRSVDLIEVDAASRTRVDDTRELLENVQYAPTRSRYKIYLIDEVHMLSAHSFNALLKTLEEPPPHVKFLLATTDPQKLPVTVLSRCLQFNLKRLPAGLIAAHLRRILEAEAVAFEPAALLLLAQAGDGSLRDALSLLDQLLAYGNGRALESEAREMLGTVARDQVERIAGLLAAGDAAALLAYASELEPRSPDYAQLLEQLASLLERVAFRQLLPALEDDERHAPELLAHLAGSIAPEDLQLYYQTAILGRRDLPLAPDAPTGFRMTLIRMLAFRPAPPELAAQRSPAARSSGTAAGTVDAQPDTSGSGARGAAGDDAAAEDAAPPPGGGEWSAILNALDLQGAPKQLAAHCALLAHEEGSIRLALDPRGAGLRTSALEDKLVRALSAYFNRPVRLQIEVREPPVRTPAQESARAAAERLRQARAAFEGDAAVQTLQARFDARVIADSVRAGDAAESAAAREAAQE